MKLKKKRLMKLNNADDESDLSVEDLSKCTSTNVYFFFICIVGPVIGATLGILYPIIIVTLPIFYVFGQNGGKIINALLLMSMSSSELKKEKDDKKKDETPE